MQNLKRKLFLIGMYLKLISLSLTGCGEKDGSYTYKVMNGSTKICYEEDNTISSSLTYEEVDKYLKVVTIEQNDFVNSYLMLKDYDCSIYGAHYTKLKYLELDTGVVIFDYYWNEIFLVDELASKEPDTINVGGNSNII